ncbi:hypothetical protein [Naumannella huperziae]
MFRRSATMIAALLAACAMVLGACTAADDPAYVEDEIGKIKVVRPSAWQSPLQVEAPWTVGYALAPDSVEQIQVSGDFGEYTSAAEAMASLIAQAQVSLEGFEIVETRDVELKGATTGQLVRYTIDDPQGNQVFGTWIIGAVWPYPQSVAVSILTPRHDAELERRVLDSIVVSPTRE